MKQEYDFSAEFPIIDPKELRSHRKGKALKRILTSPQSEDWVTWTVMRALGRVGRTVWWPKVVDLASENGADVDSLPPRDAPPNMALWHSVPTPPGYENRSRARMAGSSDPCWQERARNPGPVEGDTEVDIALDGLSYLIFVEAKLGSDVSERTSYDPERNQILRNIDCAIERAGDRRPYFWMFVKDRSPERLYWKLIRDYRTKPESLARRLPHRDPAVLARMTKGIAVIEWRDLVSLLPDTPDTTDVLGELRRRAGAVA